MIVLVCGSRSWRDPHAIADRLAKLPRGTTIVHGGARGADALAGTVANSLGLEVLEIPADWKRYGRSAGYRRNVAMLDDYRPALVLAFWDGRSTGTAHTVREANERRIPVEIVRPQE